MHTANPPIHFKWKPIEDFAGDPKALTDGELRALKRVWESQKTSLLDPEAVRQFDERLRREWSIETGILEKAYTLDRGVTRTLIERGISAALIPHGSTDRDPELVARIIQDHHDALEGMFDLVGGQRRLSTGYIKELHAALLRNQPTYTVIDPFGMASERSLEKGQYKNSPNSPTRPDGSVHEYCPPEHVASEMDRLIELHEKHEEAGVPVEVEAAWLHHRFTQIHPFADGNGRVARAIASLVFIKAGWFPPVVRRDDWGRYIDSLEKADLGDLRLLIGLFVEAQRSAVIQATEVAYEANPPTSAEGAIEALRDRLVQRGKLPSPEWLQARISARDLADLTAARLGGVVASLNSQISQSGSGFSFSVRRPPTHMSNLYLNETGQPFHDEISLSFKVGESDTRLSIVFEEQGPRFRGIVIVRADFVYKEQGPVAIEGSDFQINYEEAQSEVQTRYKAWLERAIVAALTEWRQTL